RRRSARGGLRRRRGPYRTGSQPRDESRSIGVTSSAPARRPRRMTAFLLGALAGLAVAMPVGPVGVLLMRSGMVDGVRVAVAAARGIATVDLLSRAGAVAVGAPVSRLVEAHEQAIRVVSASVLV